MDAKREFEALHVRPKPGRTLIAGSRIYRDHEDRRKRYANAEGWDVSAGEGVDRVIDMEEPLPKDAGTFTHVECLSVLEHSRRPWLLAANIERVLEPGGTLHIAVPFCWRVHGYPNDYWRFTAAGLRELFVGIKWRAVLYASQVLTKKVTRIDVDEFPYFPRSEVLAFGWKR